MLNIFCLQKVYTILHMKNRKACKSSVGNVIYTTINCRNIFLVSLNSQQFNSFQSINYFIYTTLTILIYEKTSREFIVKDDFVRNISEEFSWNSLKYTEIVLQNNYQKSMPFLMADNTIYQSKLKCGLFSECQYNQ